MRTLITLELSAADGNESAARVLKAAKEAAELIRG
jgi:hypothetical protein